MGVTLIYPTALEQLHAARRLRIGVLERGHAATSAAVSGMIQGVEYWFQHPGTNRRTAVLLEAELQHFDLV